jgi:hypothetical protein
MNRIPRYRTTTLLAILSLAASAAFANVYTWTDANGNRVFSDQPGPGSEPVKLGPVNTVEIAPAPQLSTPSGQGATQQLQQGPRYERLVITNHQNDEAVRANDGRVTLVVETEPPLSRGHLLRAEIGGQPASVAVPGNGERVHQLLLNNIDRGSHSVTATVVDARGEVVQRSAPLELHIQRTSLNQPSRAGGNQAPQAPAAPRAPNVPAPGGN